MYVRRTFWTRCTTEFQIEVSVRKWTQYIWWSLCLRGSRANLRHNVLVYDSIRILNGREFQTKNCKTIKPPSAMNNLYSCVEHTYCKHNTVMQLKYFFFFLNHRTAKIKYTKNIIVGKQHAQMAYTSWRKYAKTLKNVIES